MGGLGNKSAPKVKCKNYVYMGWFEVELSGMGGCVFNVFNLVPLQWGGGFSADQKSNFFMQNFRLRRAFR